VRSVIYYQLEPSAWPGPGLSILNKIIIFCILAAVTLAILDTEPTIRVFPYFLKLMAISDSIFAIIFTLELILRVWVIGENPHYQGLKGRLRFMMRPTTLIDIAALIPFYLTVGTNGGFMLRLFRFLRILSLARLGRYSKALHLLASAVHKRRFELLISLSFAGLILLVSATCLFLSEGEGQPEAFGSIPRALWWSVATLTTVGYGDVYPMTTIGRILGGITAITGIGIIAMPTGIIAAAFSDAFQKRKDS